MDVGKREDRMLDVISTLQHQRDETRAALEFYTEAKLLSEEVSAHLWEILTGMTKFNEEENDDNLVSSDQPER